MVKKFLAIIILVFYAAMSTGATVSLHYCMGKFEGISLLKGTDKCKSCKSNQVKECKKSCCKDKVKLVKSEKDQKIERVFDFLTFFAVETAQVTSFFTDAKPSYVSNTLLAFSDAPPRSSKVALHIIHCVFRL